jgi:hypothetical protein
MLTCRSGLGILLECTMYSPINKSEDEHMLRDQKQSCKRYMLLAGARGSLLAEALCYKPEVAGLIPDEATGFFK